MWRPEVDMGYLFDYILKKDLLLLLRVGQFGQACRPNIVVGDLNSG